VEHQRNVRRMKYLTIKGIGDTTSGSIIGSRGPYIYRKKKLKHQLWRSKRSRGSMGDKYISCQSQNRGVARAGQAHCNGA
jgi:hypothetical protein